MENKIKVLIRGYVKVINNKQYASSTAVLIQENGKSIIIDPGINRRKLLLALKKQKLETSNIDYVILTHYHLDHLLLAGIFENAKIYDNESVFSFDGKIENHKHTIPNTSIVLIDTPGHDPFHISVLAKNKNDKNIVIAGEVFWWPNNAKIKTDRKSLINLKDPYTKSKKQLIQSRKNILSIADYIIPGHGKMFKVIK